jgi:hypothetical protein
MAAAAMRRSALSPASLPAPLQNIETMLILCPEYGLHPTLGLSSVTVNFSRSTMES